jgi:Ribose/xylose/arabinose/galactoside ABC-type transport systems, permease components
MRTPKLLPQKEDQKIFKDELTDKLPFIRRKIEFLDWIWRYRKIKTKPKEISESRFETQRYSLRWKKLHPRNISVLYLYVIIFSIFSLWVPETWLTSLTHKTILNQEAVLIIVSLGLIIPLAAGVFDLSIGAVISLSSMLVSWMIINAEMNIIVSCIITIIVGSIIGVINAFLIIKSK